LQELRLAGEGVTFADVDDDVNLSDIEVVLQGLTGLQELRRLALLRLDLTDERDDPGDFALDDLTSLTQLTQLELECLDSQHLQADNYKSYSCVCQALAYIPAMRQLRALRLAVQPQSAAGWIPFIVLQLPQLQHIEYFAGDSVEDFEKARQLWRGRPGVCVAHIEADGSTTHVCGGACMEG
jgi:hypothetical protein